MACGSHGARHTMLRQCRRAGWSALTTRLRWSQTCRRVQCGRPVPCARRSSLASPTARAQARQREIDRQMAEARLSEQDNWRLEREQVRQQSGPPLSRQVPGPPSACPRALATVTKSCMERGKERAPVPGSASAASAVAQVSVAAAAAQAQRAAERGAEAEMLAAAAEVAAAERELAAAQGAADAAARELAAAEALGAERAQSGRAGAAAAAGGAAGRQPLLLASSGAPSRPRALTLQGVGGAWSCDAVRSASVVRVASVRR